MLGRTELADRNLAVLGTGILGDTLSVVSAVDIHLAAAVGTVEQACKGSCFAPAIRVSLDIASDFLHKVKGLLVDNRLMGVLKNRPFVLRHIMAFLVLEVFSGLEIDRMSEVFSLFQNFNHSRRTPAINVLECLVLVYSLAILCKVSGRNEDLFL